MRRLVVTADDFGAAVEVNDAVEHGHRDGVLTAASLMMAGGAVEDAVRRAKAMPKLGVGLHVTLIEGRSVLPRDQIPDLVDRQGVFRKDIVWQGVRMFALPKVRRQLYREVEAQFEAFARTGLKLDHVDAHLHFHLHPTILGAILKVGARHGMTMVRTPIEPPDVLEAAEPMARVPSAIVTEPWARRVRARTAKAGIRSPDHVFGLHWTGAMTAPRLQRLIENLPEGLSEIYMHPATRGGFEFSTPDGRYAEEAEALTRPEVKAAVKASGVKLGTFTDFAAG